MPSASIRCGGHAVQDEFMAPKCTDTELTKNFTVSCSRYKFFCFAFIFFCVWAYRSVRYDVETLESLYPSVFTTEEITLLVPRKRRAMDSYVPYSFGIDGTVRVVSCRADGPSVDRYISLFLKTGP